MMKRLVLLAMVAALVVPAMAAPTTWSETESGVIGTYWFLGTHEVDATVTLAVSYVDGMTPIGDVDYFIPTHTYSDSDGQFAHLYLQSGQNINVTLSWSGVPNLHAGFGVDYLTWDGENTGNKDGAIYEWEYYRDIFGSSSGSETFVLNFDIDSGQLAINNSSYAVDSLFFDIFGQANKTQGGPKLGIGARLDFSPVAPAVIPAPGAILLAGIATPIVGWLRRRRSL